MSSELSLVLQIVALGIIIFGFILVKQKYIKIHGTTMFTAAILNMVSVLTGMVPIAIRLADNSIPGFNPLFRIHIIVGLVVIITSGYLLVEWRFQKPSQTCYQRKKWMLGLSLVWIAQVILGILLFMSLYLHRR
jgi:uncharacterized membrane protein YozB (DUF420 family)